MAIGDTAALTTDGSLVKAGRGGIERGLVHLAAGRLKEAAESIDESLQAAVAFGEDQKTMLAIMLALRGDEAEADRLLESIARSKTKKVAGNPRLATADMLRFSGAHFDPVPGERERIAGRYAELTGVPDKGVGDAVLVSCDWSYFSRYAPLLVENARVTQAAAGVTFHLHFVDPADRDLAADFAGRFGIAASCEVAPDLRSRGEASAYYTCARFHVARYLLEIGRYRRIATLDCDGFVKPGLATMLAGLGEDEIAIAHNPRIAPWTQLPAGLCSFGRGERSLEYLRFVSRYMESLRLGQELRWRIDQCALFATWYYLMRRDGAPPTLHNLGERHGLLVRFPRKSGEIDAWRQAARPGSGWPDPELEYLRDLAARLPLPDAVPVIEAVLARRTRRRTDWMGEGGLGRTDNDVFQEQLQLAARLVNEKQTDDALEILFECLSREPESPTALMLAAVGLLNSGDAVRTMEMVTRLIRLAPQRAKPYAIACQAMARPGEMSRKRRLGLLRSMLRRLVALAPGDAGHHKAQFEAAQEAGDHEEARSALVNYTQLRPDDRKYLRRLVTYHLRLGDLDRASAVLDGLMSSRGQSTGDGPPEQLDSLAREICQVRALMAAEQVVDRQVGTAPGGRTEPPAGSNVAVGGAEGELVDWICSAIARGRLGHHPYRHLLVADLLPADVARQVAANMPDKRFFGFSPNFPKRGNITLSMLSQLEREAPEKAAFWARIFRALQTDDCLNAFLGALDAAPVAEAVRLAGCDIRLSARLSYELPGHRQDPHQDSPSRLGTMMLYLPTRPAAEGLGTWMCEIIEQRRMWDHGLHVKPKDFRRVGMLGGTFNQAFGFLNVGQSYHAVDPVPEGAVRHVILLTLYLEPRDLPPDQVGEGSEMNRLGA